MTTTQRKTKREAVHHLADVQEALERLKAHGRDNLGAVDDPTFAEASDALTALNDALFALGVPGDVIHDHPERLRDF